MENISKLLRGGVRNRAIDFLRFLAMVAVVFLHSTFPGVTGELIEVIARFAVPVFFMISGYFLRNTEYRTVLNRAKKTAGMLIVTVSIYTVYALLDEGVLSVLNQINMTAIVKLFLLNTPPDFMGMHTWYLFALIYCYIAVAYLKKKNAFDKMSRLMPFLLLISVCISSILPGIGIIDPHNTLYRNAYFTGLPFVSLGYLIRKYEFPLESPKLLLGVFVGIVLSFIERYFLIEADLYVGTVLLAVSLFSYVLSSSRRFRVCSTIGRQYSGVVYIIHVLVMLVLDKLLENIGLQEIMFVSWLLPFLVLGLSVGIAFLWSTLVKSFVTIKRSGNV